MIYSLPSAGYNIKVIAYSIHDKLDIAVENEYEWERCCGLDLNRSLYALYLIILVQARSEKFTYQNIIVVSSQIIIEKMITLFVLRHSLTGFH